MARRRIETWIDLMTLVGLTVTWGLMARAARPFDSEFQRHTGFFVFLLATGLPYFLIAALAAYSRPFPRARKVAASASLIAVIGGIGVYVYDFLQTAPQGQPVFVYVPAAQLGLLLPLALALIFLHLRQENRNPKP